MTSSASDRREVLSGTRVIDLSEGLAGSVAALLLAESGAEVVKVESGKSAARDSRATFAVWNRSKKGVHLDWQGADRDELAKLLSAADILVHDLPPPQARQLGLDAKALSQTHPGLILTSVSGFPAGHAYEEFPTDDILVGAQLGLFDEVAPVKRDGPAYLRFPLGSWAAALLAASGAIVRLLQRDRDGKSGPVSTSLVQGAFVTLNGHWRVAENPTDAIKMGLPKTLAHPIFQCSDGEWLHFMSPPDHVPLMKEAMDRLGPEAIARENEAGPFSPLLPNAGANRAIVAERPSQEWLDACWAEDVAVQKAAAFGGLYEDEQAIANGYVETVEDPELGLTKQPGPWISMDPPLTVKGPAPQLGEHQKVIEDWLNRPGPGSFELTTDKPLKGLKVIDFGIHVAGPLTSMMLGDLGADVIKIEGLRGDPLRPHEWAFTVCSRNKRSLALDMKHESSKDVLHRLIRSADVMLSNLRLSAAERFGLTYKQAREINPALIHGHVSGYGQKGPRSQWPGYDQLFQAITGWEYEGAGEGNQPIWHRFGMMDHQCAMSMLYGVLLALLKRQNSGSGSEIACSILGASMFTISETVQLSDGSLTPYPKLDSLQLGVSDRQRMYACRDGWIVLSVSQDAYRNLTAATEVSNTNELERKLEGMSMTDAVELINKTGGQAVPVNVGQAERFLKDPDNSALGLVADYPHPVYGRYRQCGGFWTFGAGRFEVEQSIPKLGEHTHTILKELGFSEADISTFVKENAVFADT